MEYYSNGSFVNTEIFNAREQLIYSTLALILITVGIILNFMFIVAYYTNKSIKQNKFNFDLMQLSITFIIQNIGFSPYVLLDVRDFLKYGGGPPVVYILCGMKDGMGLFFVGANCSICILCSMTYTRYQLIKHPLRERNRFSKKRSNQLFAFFWIVSLVFIAPNFVTLYAYNDLPFCMRTPAFQGIFLKFYGVSTISIGYFIPFTLLVLIYAKVFYEFYHSKNLRPQSSQIQNSREHYKKRAVRRLAFVVISFVCYWFPLLCGWVIGFSGYYDLSLQHQIRKARMYRFVLFPCLFPAIVSVVSHVFLNSKIRKSILNSTRRIMEMHRK